MLLCPICIHLHRHTNIHTSSHCVEKNLASSIWIERNQRGKQTNERSRASKSTIRKRQQQQSGKKVLPIFCFVLYCNSIRWPMCVQFRLYCIYWWLLLMHTGRIECVSLGIASVFMCWRAPNLIAEISYEPDAIPHGVWWLSLDWVISTPFSPSPLLSSLRLLSHVWTWLCCCCCWTFVVNLKFIIHCRYDWCFVVDNVRRSW